MAEPSEQDQIALDETERHDHAVCFAEALAEELIEVDALRQQREVERHDASRDLAEWGHVTRIANKAGASEREDKEGKAAAGEATTVVGQARQMKLAGLAFSGGGIRSATFNLGVLQGLAQYNKVRTFDYLSTVSGGGYIGGWLEAWISRSGQQQREMSAKGEVKTPLKGIHAVEEELRPTRSEREKSVAHREWADQKSHTEPPQIRFLREYSNYLTPRLGALGADTWTVIAIYLRNVLLNQAILILFSFALLLLPYIAHFVTGWMSWTGMWAAPVAVFALMTWAVTVGARNLDGLIYGGEMPERVKTWLPPQEQRWVLITIVAPICLAIWILTAWLWPNTGVWDASGNFYLWPMGGIALIGLPLVIGSLAAPAQPMKLGWIKYPKIIWVLASIATGAVAGTLMWACVHLAFHALQGLLGSGAEWHELSLGVPLTSVVFLLSPTIFVGLMGRTFCDPYREWWARVAGWILIFTIVWSAGFGIAIYAPLGLIWLRSWLKISAVVAWIGSTLTGVLSGKSDKTGDIEEGGIKVNLLSITPYIFIVGLLAILSLSLELILARIYSGTKCVADALDTFLKASPGIEKVADWALRLTGNMASGTLTLSGTAAPPAAPPPPAFPAYVAAHFKLLDSVAHLPLIPACVAVLLFCWWLSSRVDLNEFSMNLMYRNRLVRCYLGATREMRNPNPFSGLDSGDDLFLSTLQSSHGYSGPLPILNGTLNLVSTRDLAWQERKAESFPMTPLRCGFDTWIEQGNLEKNFARDKKMGSAHHIAKYAFRPTDKYGYVHDGFYVGTAVSISGAAASPNMGYHSVPSLAILMTFFNVRLGFWAGNPRSNDTWTNPGPRVGLGQLLCELFGLTNDNAKYVYLSDGGHFENLGIYELVKRRCKYIVAVDAGEDPNYAFEDLGNAIRKCREDIGVEIEIDTRPLVPKGGGASVDKNGGGQKLSAQHCVFGTIDYTTADPHGDKGVLIYIKASLTGDEPADVLNYQTAHTVFPHESTADQWFSESQFESYRRLGQHVVESLFVGKQDPTHPKGLTAGTAVDAFRSMDTEALFKKLENNWQELAQPPAKKKTASKAQGGADKNAGPEVTHTHT